MKTVKQNFMKFLKYVSKGGVYGMYFVTNGGGDWVDTRLLEGMA